jgi:hypothetical protein
MALDPLGLFLLGTNLKEFSTTFGLMSLFFGLLVLWKPNIISYLIGTYLVLTGLLILFGSLL